MIKQKYLLGIYEHIKDKYTVDTTYAICETPIEFAHAIGSKLSTARSIINHYFKDGKLEAQLKIDGDLYDLVLIEIEEDEEPVGKTENSVVELKAI